MPSSWSNAVLIVAAGSGSRLNAEVPKVFLHLSNVPLWLFPTLSFAIHLPVTALVIVVPSSYFQQPSLIAFHHPLFSLSYRQSPDPNLHEFTLRFRNGKYFLLHIVPGGKERYHSVWNGLQRICQIAHEKRSHLTVWIHDAARPFLIPEVIKTMENQRNQEPSMAYFPKLPVSDTLRRKQEETSITVPRREYFLVQTPQIFPFPPLFSAYSIETAFADVTDDLMVFERNQGKVTPVPGTPFLFKITFPEDYQLASAFAPTFWNQHIVPYLRNE